MRITARRNAERCRAFSRRPLRTLTAFFQGYTGLLCGDCEAGYGHSSSFDCDQCDTGLSIATLAISIMLVLALSSFAIRSSLVPVQNPRRDARASRRRMSRRFIGVATSAPASIQLAPLVSRSNPPPRSRHTQNEASQEDGGESSAVMAKWKTVEIFKVRLREHVLTITACICRSPSIFCK